MRLRQTDLDDEVGDDAAVVGVHAGAEGVEDPRHAHVHAPCHGTARDEGMVTW
jgi:hypothetical protein